MRTIKIKYLKSIIIINSGEQARAQAAAAAEAAAAQQAAMAAVEAEAKQETAIEPSAASTIDFSEYTHRIVSFLARNFYNLKYVALVLAFCINFMLLFYKVRNLIIRNVIEPRLSYDFS